MDSALDDNQVEFAAGVSVVSLEMLSHGDSLLDKLEEIFRKSWGASVLLKDSEDLLAGDESNLGNTVLISEGHADLGWGHT